MLIDVQDLVASDDQALKALADELNSVLPEYRVTYTHFDTGDYLEFVEREASDDVAMLAFEEELSRV